MSENVTITDDLAEHVEEALREDGAMPRWQVEEVPPRPGPLETVASLRLSEHLTLRIHREQDWAFGNISFARGLLPDGDLDRQMTLLPGRLAPEFEAAAAKLRRIDSMTPREVTGEEGGAE